MNKDYIYKSLINKGFSGREANILADNLKEISIELQSNLRSWLESGEEIDFNSNGMSISSLMDKYKLQYQAALLTMDWVIKEPDIAINAIKNGIR